MGLFSFVKDAGETVMGLNQHQPNLTQKEQLNQKDDTDEKGRRLEQTIKGLKLQVEDLTVKVADDSVIICGKAKDQGTKEKIVLVIGNTKGIASVDDQMSVEHAENESQFHTVIKGETLTDIALHYYGKENLYNEIFKANHPLLENPDNIYPGQVLRIPTFEN